MNFGVLKGNAATERGFVLLSVVLAISIVALVAFLLSNQTGGQIAIAAGELQRDELRYVAEAGMAHAQWQLAQNTTCTSYLDLAATNFKGHTYDATISPTDGSPVMITATGTLASGASLTRADLVQAFSAPSPHELQPGAESEDTYIWDGAHKDINFGATAYMELNNASAERVILMRFDLSSVPAGTRITNATLDLWLEGGSGLSNGVIDAHRPTQIWFEGEEDDNPPVAPGATYMDYDGTNPWASSGGDYDPVPVSTTVISNINPSWHQWDVTALVEGGAQSALSTDGVLLRASGGNVDKIKFTSSDGTPANRPKLTLTYGCECGSVCSTPGSTQPIAHWQFDDASGLTAIDAVGGHDGTLTSGPAWAPGQIDGALNFDGNNDYVVVDHSDTLSLTKQLTFTAWVNASSFGSSYQSILVKDNGGADSNFWFGTYQRDLAFGFYANGNFREEFTSGLNLQTDSWYHVVATFDNDSGQVRLFVNSSQVHAGTIGFTASAVSSDLSIGRSPDGEYWRGALDDVRLYDRILTEDEIAELYQESAGGPIAHWKLDETGGTTAEDSQGGNDGTLVNGPTWNADGQFDGALDFDEFNDFVKVADFDFGPDFTLSFGFKVDSNVGSLFKYIISHGDINNVNSLNVFLNESSHGTDPDMLRTVVRDSNDALSNTALEFDLSSAVGDGEWHTYTLTVASGVGATVYLDGVQQNSDSRGGDTFDPTTDLFFAARRDLDANRLFGGSLDDIRIYDYALSGFEVDLYFGAGGAGDDGGDGDQKCSATIMDDFESGDYAGSTGTRKWSTDWEEFGDDGDPTGQDERIQFVDRNWELRVQDNNGGGEGVFRQADTSSSKELFLRLEYWRFGLDNENDYVALEVSESGGDDWTEIDRFAGRESDDGEFIRVTHDIQKFSSSKMQIRLISSPTLGNNDQVFFDNIQICLVE